MRKLVLALALIIPLVFLSGCTIQNTEISANLEEPFKLKIGHSAFFQEEGLRITFVNVTRDSRCPAGVECFWAGEVGVLLKAEKGAGTEEFELFLPRYAASIGFDKYEIELVSVSPYPVQGEKIESSEYEAGFVVSRLGAGFELNCSNYRPENCPKSCVVCPPCEFCSSISCNTEEFCESIGFNRSWFGGAVK